MPVRAVQGTRLVLCALALVVGLLGMHGLGSHHAGMPGMTAVTTAAHHDAVQEHAVGDVLGALPAGAGTTGADALCLAVLGSGLVVLLALAGGSRRAGGGGHRSAPPRAVRPVLLGARDPVVLLCVSRT